MDEYIETMNQKIKEIESEVNKLKFMNEFFNTQFSNILKSLSNHQKILKIILDDSPVPKGRGRKNRKA